MLGILLRISYAWRRARCAFSKHVGQETYEVARPRWPAWASIEIRCARCDATIKVEERGMP